ncbi:MAG: M20 family metallopeptidase [Lachnospiraceae bacterium]|nr:M20 family metallopeptidase [Lachnospiraceae bacterium]
MSENIKEKIYECISRDKSVYTSLSDRIFDFAEVSGQEHQSTQLLTDFLRKHGFHVQTGCAMETDFRAEYMNLSGGPTIGILVEYDALEGIGHACGHHLQGPIGLAAAMAVRECLQDLPYKLIIYGTPAEETLGGKIILLEKGYLKDMDIVLMTHGGPHTQVDRKCYALENFVVTFHGIKSHAAIAPELGRSALDAALLSFHAMEMLREHVREDTRMHYTVREVGCPVNVVPDKAVAEYTLRSFDTSYLDTVVDRFFDILQGAALMTGTTYEIQRDRPFKSKIVVDRLNNLLMKNAEYYHAPRIAPPREKTGSTDFGNVLYEVPGSCLRIAFTENENAVAHSNDFLVSGKTPMAHNAIVFAAAILASSICDTIQNPELLRDIQEEFRQKKQQNESISVKNE